ncbi:tetratricopeptide repeat protein [Nocardia sp. NBC_01499]|uniref:tetratricopeptide repeat protein n=1 Tax=Nocardia sp. NBC_01499 TaxID=2903597 RepID=UPI00386844B7
MTDTGEGLAQIRRLPKDQVNTGPQTEDWIRFEKHIAALALVRELVAGTDIEGIALQHSADLIMLYHGRRPKLVSIKHKEPHQRSGDSGWSPAQLVKVIDSLYRQWTEADRNCQPAFWSNAGFVKEAREYHAHVVAGSDPPPSFVDWAIKNTKIPSAQARCFLRDLELLSEPLPRKNEALAVGAEATAKLLEKHDRGASPRFAKESFEALCSRIIELSVGSPLAPAPDTRLQLVTKLFPRLDAKDAAALASRVLPAAEAETIVLHEHDRLIARDLPEAGFRWEADDRFVGRSQALADLTTLLDPGGVKPVAPVSIRGMTGVGKTSVATQFASQCSDIMQPIFVSANSRADVVTALQQLSHTLNNPDSTGLVEARVPVTPALPATSGTLLILDGVTDSATLEGLIPRRALCRILITTTVANLDIGYRELVLGAWKHGESKHFLEEHLAHERTDAHDQLRRELHDHPLALNQAVDHCRVVERSIAEYITRLHEAPTETLQLGRASGHPVSIIESIRLNIEAVEVKSPDSITLLTLMAFLGPTPIPESIFDAPITIATIQPPHQTRLADSPKNSSWWHRLRRTPSHPPETPNPLADPAAREMRKTLRNKSSRDRAIEGLARMSLITVRRGQLSIHPLIALVAQCRTQDPRPWLEAGIGLFVPQIQPDSFFGSAPELRDYLSPAAYVTSAAFDHGFVGSAPIFVAMLLAQRLALVGPNEAATPHGWTAVDFGKRGVESAMKNAAVSGDPMWLLVAAQVRIQLVQAYSLGGQVDEALDAIAENIEFGKQLGKPQLVVSAVAAAESVATDHGRSDIAQKILIQVAELYDINFEDDFRAALFITHANVLRMLHRPDDAATVIEQALQIVDNPRSDIPAVIKVRAYGAASTVYRDQGDMQASLNYELAIVDLQRRSDGVADIPPKARIAHLLSGGDAAISAYNLELAQALVTEAEQLATECEFGHTSQVYADVFAIRGRLHHAQGHYNDARADLEKAITIFRIMPSSFRPRLPAPLLHLAQTLYALGDQKKAATLAREAYNIDCAIFGPDHIETRRDEAILNFVTGAQPMEDLGTLLSLFGSNYSSDTTALTSENRQLVDITRFLGNIHEGMKRIGADPNLEWGILDFVSEEEILIMFQKLSLGRTVIASTLESATYLLTCRFGEERLARPIGPSFDINTAAHLSFSYSREEHELARTLLNAALVDRVEIESDSQLFGDHTDSNSLIQTWLVVLTSYSFMNAALHAGF